MRIIINHSVEYNRALECSDKILKELSEKHKDKISKMQYQRNGNITDFSFNVMNFSVKGQLTVSNNNILIEGKLPLAASFFKNIIENTIRQHAGELIENCKNE